MTAAPPRDSILWLCLRFAVLAPICLVLWLLVLPSYTWLVGHAAGLFLKYVAQNPIERVAVTPGGFLNTDTSLSYFLPGIERAMPDVGHLMTNIAPFVALVLATSALGVWRRLRILGLGVVIIFVFHVVTIVLRFVAGRTSLPTAIGFIAITLPFLLWIVMAYWDKLIAYFADTDDSGAPSAPSQP